MTCVELHEAFAMFDTKNTGHITSAQLCATMESLGLCPTEASVRHMISVADTDGMTSSIIVYDVTCIVRVRGCESV